MPAPLVLTTSCGAFRLAESGRVTRLPRGWSAAHGGGTGRSYGADLQIRRTRAGRYLVLRHGRLVWRSRGLYPNDGGNVAFGPDAFAFAGYRRGVFATDLKGPERLVAAGRGRYPLDFTSSGRLLVSGGRAIVVVSPRGGVERRYPFRPGNGFAFDHATDRLFFVTPTGLLAIASEAAVRLVRPSRGLRGILSFSPPDVLLFQSARSLTVTTGEGTLLARAGWPRSSRRSMDSGVSVSGDGRRFAFRLSDARPGAKSGSAAVFVLAAGARRARMIYRHRLGRLGCAVGADMRWQGEHLLYSSADGDLAILRPRGRMRLDLARVARALPRRWAEERATAAWAAGRAVDGHPGRRGR